MTRNASARNEMVCKTLLIVADSLDPGDVLDDDDAPSDATFGELGESE